MSTWPPSESKLPILHDSVVLFVLVLSLGENWLKSVELAGYSSVSHSVKVCTRLPLPVTNWLSKEWFHNDREMSKCCEMYRTAKRKI